MQEILKKIEEKINAPIGEYSARALDDSLNMGYLMGLEKAKEIILSEQKEPCTEPKMCPKCQKIMNYDSWFKKMMCRQCGHMEEPEQRPLTIGDKIRESNEGLSELLVNGSCCKYCIMKNAKCPPHNPNCRANVLAYLNQPYTK